MMAYRDFVSLVHKSTKRDYLARVTQRDKADVAEMAVKFDYDYWDGSRETGYGGYKYDGRWRKVADAMVATYGIKPGPLSRKSWSKKPLPEPTSSTRMPARARAFCSTISARACRVLRSRGLIFRRMV